jgi:hypothetical protein
MPFAVLVIAAVCVVLTLAGAALATYQRQAVTPWLTLLTTLLFVAALVTMFSYGALFLVAAVISLLFRLRAPSTQRPRRFRSRIGAALLLSLGFAP